VAYWHRRESTNLEVAPACAIAQCFHRIPRLASLASVFGRALPSEPSPFFFQLIGALFSKNNLQKQAFSAGFVYKRVVGGVFLKEKLKIIEVFRS